MIEFIWPWALTLLPLPLVIYVLLPPVATQEAALYVPFFNSLKQLGGEQKSTFSRKNLTALSASLIWLLLLIACCRPQWVGDPIQLPSNGRDLMLAVDISGSMEAQDMRLNTRPVSRLTVVKSVVGDFVQRRQGDRLGLILFAARAYLQAPLTFDRNTVQTLLYEAEIGIIEKSSTAIGDAIGLSVKHLRQRPENSRVLILLTDGVNNAGEIPPLQAGELAAKEKIKIYTIGIGAESMVEKSLWGTRVTNPSADLDEETLSKIATKTGGRYFRARDVYELEEIYEELNKLELIEQEQETFRPIKALFYWPLSTALLLSFFIVCLRLPWTSYFPQSFSQMTQPDPVDKLRGINSE